MITKFKIFENFENETFSKGDYVKIKGENENYLPHNHYFYQIEYILDDLEYQLKQEFKTEKDWENWCCDVDNVDDYGDCDLSNISSYDVPELLGLPVNNNDIQNIMTNLLTGIDFDKEYVKDENSSIYLKDVFDNDLGILEYDKKDILHLTEPEQIELKMKLDAKKYNL